MEWRYLAEGEVKHALYRADDSTAACGRWTWSTWWLGTGSQNEYERVEALPACKRCLEKLPTNAAVDAPGGTAGTPARPKEFRTLGEFVDAVKSTRHDNAVEATLQWMLAHLQKMREDYERDGLTPSPRSFVTFAEVAADQIRAYRRLAQQPRSARSPE